MPGGVSFSGTNHSRVGMNSHPDSEGPVGLDRAVCPGGLGSISMMGPSMVLLDDEVALTWGFVPSGRCLRAGGRGEIRKRPGGTFAGLIAPDLELIPR